MAVWPWLRFENAMMVSKSTGGKVSDNASIEQENINPPYIGYRVFESRLRVRPLTRLW